MMAFCDARTMPSQNADRVVVSWYWVTPGDPPPHHHPLGFRELSVKSQMAKARKE
jgi:hypothetical protein